MGLCGGLVDLDEFVTGYLKLRGDAKAVDIAKLLHENKLILRAIEKINMDLRGICESVAASASVSAEAFRRGSAPPPGYSSQVCKVSSEALRRGTTPPAGYSNSM